MKGTLAKACCVEKFTNTDNNWIEHPLLLPSQQNYSQQKYLELVMPVDVLPTAQTYHPHKVNT